jgi:hypothetical protein
VDEETRLTNTVLVRLACIAWFTAAQLLPVTSALAQSIDVEPPVIEHDVVESATSSDRQSFFATVADDDELASVRFLYRFAGQTTYTSLEMQRVSYSSTFSVEIPTTAGDDRAIEYYISARDTSGNRTLRGYNFSPLVRLIEVPDTTAQPLDQAVLASAKKRPLYYVAGALVLGAVVGALARSSSGGDSPDPTGNCENGLCDFTVTINPPGAE